MELGSALFNKSRISPIRESQSLDADVADFTPQTEWPQRGRFGSSGALGAKAGIGALRPVAHDATYGRRCPFPDLAGRIKEPARMC